MKTRPAGPNHPSDEEAPVVGAHDENTPVTPQAVEQTFEQKVLKHFQQQIIQACATIPELRSVAVVFDWQHNLNHAAQPFVWGDRNGPMTRENTTAVVGGLAQTTLLLEYELKLLRSAAVQFTELVLNAKQELQQAEETSDDQEEVALPPQKDRGPEPVSGQSLAETQDSAG